MGAALMTFIAIMGCWHFQIDVRLPTAKEGRKGGREGGREGALGE
jgi:hypothetical protein